MGSILTLVKGNERPPYSVIKSETDYELRSYPGAKWVQTQQTAASRADVSSSMFMTLFGYIAGRNEKEESIKMTAPVTTRMALQTTPTSERTFTMAFYIPSAFQNTPPAPADANVAIEDRPAMKVFVRTFGGWANSDSRVQEEYNLLLDSLTKEDREKVQPNAPFYLAGYDPPFKFFGRTNEIWLMHVDQ